VRHVFKHQPRQRHKPSKAAIRRAKFAARLLVAAVELYLAIHGPVMT
jgi:hypothetical protein